jgi:hypothetical protein
MGVYLICDKQYATDPEGTVDDKLGISDGQVRQMANQLGEYLGCYCLYGYTLTGEPIKLVNSSSHMEANALSRFIEDIEAGYLDEDLEKKEYGFDPYEDEDDDE